MAMSTCEKCGNHSFAVVEQEPAHSNFKWFFVQCQGCGTPVGVVDFYPNSTVINRIEAIEKAITSLESTIATIDYNIRLLAQRRN